MVRLVDDLLDDARAERSRGMEPIDLGDVVRQALANLRSEIEACEARIEVGDLPTALGDRTGYLQVFQNLLGNALKYRRGPRPHVRVAARNVEGQVWEVSVEDDGPGIEECHHRDIFKPLHRIHVPGGPEGTGLGLATTRKVVERYGGRIWVESQPGRGSVFRLTLRVPARDQEPPALPAAGSRAEPAPVPPAGDVRG
jgi:signal transduction histidine kinase